MSVTWNGSIKGNTVLLQGSHATGELQGTCEQLTMKENVVAQVGIWKVTVAMEVDSTTCLERFT